jgi:hypothetical protein
MGRLTPTTTTYQNPRSGSEFALGAPCMSTPTRGAEDLCTQSNMVGRSGGKPRDKLGNGADSDDVNLQPRQHKRQQSATTAQQFLVQPYNAEHRLTAGVCWKELCKGAGVLAS